VSSGAYADPRWRAGHYPADDGPEAGFAVEGWLHHHGRALVARFRKGVENGSGREEGTWVA
jgi:hypothetical protein